MLKRYETDDFRMEKSSYEDLVQELDSVGGFVKTEALPSAGGRPINYYAIGNESEGAPTIIMDGSIHNAHEWKSAHGMLEMMRVLSSPDLYLMESELVRYLLTKYRFIVLPVVSPDSYAGSKSPNDNGVIINNNFDYKFENGDQETRGPYAFSENESCNIRDLVLGNNTALYINTHSYGDGKSVVLLMARKDLRSDVNYYIKSSLDDTTESYSYKERTLHSSINNNSSSYNWARSQVNDGGDRVAGVVMEPGSKLQLWQNKNVTVYSFFSLINYFDSKPDVPKAKQKNNRFFAYPYCI